MKYIQQKNKEKNGIYALNKKYILIGFFISILLHGALLLILRLVEIPSLQNYVEVGKKSNYIGINLFNKIEKKVSNSFDQTFKNSNHQKEKIKSNPDQKISFQNLNLSNGPSIGKESYALTQEYHDSIGKFGDKLEGGNYLEDGDNSIYAYLYKYIGTHIYYPRNFREKEIEGYVTIRIVFDKKGNYLHDLSKVNSNSRYLKVLMSRTLKSIFKDPLTFDLHFVKQKYFIVDAKFIFNANPDNDKDYISSNAFSSGHSFNYLIQNDSVAILGLRKNNEGVIRLGLNYEDFGQWMSDSLTSAGKSRKQFRERELETYKDDPAWDN